MQIAITTVQSEQSERVDEFDSLGSSSPNRGLDMYNT